MEEQNIIFIIAEGDHDTAFLYRILKAFGARTINKPIKEYPSPLGELFKCGIVDIPFEELNIQNTRSHLLPYRVMTRESNTFLLYAIGGDSQEQRRKDLVKRLKSFIATDPNSIPVISEKTSISILFFFDADNKGTAARMSQLENELRDIIIGIPHTLEAQNIYIINKIGIGAFIFAEKDSDTGALENILLPLMRQNNDDIFTAAESFLNIHETSLLFKGKVTYNEDYSVKKKINGEKYDHLKSLIGTVGQLQKSGKSNTICVSDADYLNETKIKSDPTCTDIHNFISKAIK